MLTSRRNFIRAISAGAAAQAALPLARTLRGNALEPTGAIAPGGPIRLNRNENVYGPCRKALAAIHSALSTANRYPYGDCAELARRIASFHNVQPEQVLLGCGSTEIMRVAAVAFLGRGKQLVQASPTFEAIERYARSTGAEVLSVPLDRTYAHDLDDMLARANTSTALVYICNPNNPTATITPRKDLDSFIRNLHPSCYILIDEAYHDYAGRSSTYASFIDHPINAERVIVCRTFSKVYGLAGLRLGYCIAAPAIIERMRSHITFNSVNGMVVRAATAALEDTESVREFVKQNTDDRQEFFNQAISRMLRPIDSHANFVMMSTNHPAREVVEHFRKDNILLGCPVPAMDIYIRVSLGTPSEMRAFWRTWDKSPYAKAPMHH
jgi:histidinol-phosphate aminotransferase